MPDFQSMLDAFNAPNTKHAMFVHFPIVLSIVGAVMVLAAAILRKNATVRMIAIACQAVLVLAVLATVNSGEHANDAIDKVLTPEVYDLVAKHEQMAGRMWLFAVGTTLLLSLSVLWKNTAGAALAWLAVLASVAGIGWVSVTAHHGGELVYRFGVGTPQPVACFDIPGVHSDGRDHAAEHAAAQNAASQPATTQRESASEVTPEIVQGELPDAAKIAFFRDEAFPILSEHCFNCHNAARVGRDKSGRLDQTSREALLKGGRSGPAIIVGKPEDSLLLHRMRGEIADARMMPPDGQLSDKQIAIIEQWILDGAVWADPGSR